MVLLVGLHFEGSAGNADQGIQGSDSKGEQSLPDFSYLPDRLFIC